MMTPPYSGPVLALLAPRSWGAHLLLVAALVAAALLGRWQYDGWQARRAAEAQDLTFVAPVPLAEALGPDDPFPASSVGRPTVVEGTWLPGDPIYVAGREHEGQTGYWVVGAVLVPGDAGSASVLPAVRGWTAEPGGAGPTSGETRFVGWLQPSDPAAAAPVDSSGDPSADVVASLRIPDLAQRFDQDLYGGYVVVAPASAGDGPPAWAGFPAGDRAVNPGTEGLAPADPEQLPDAGRFTALRNLLYALEWWFFGLFAVVIWWRWARETVGDERRRRVEEPAAPVGG